MIAAAFQAVNLNMVTCLSSSGAFSSAGVRQAQYQIANARNLGHNSLMGRRRSVQKETRAVDGSGRVSCGEGKWSSTDYAPPKMRGGPRGDRTHDPVIKSHVLYH